jgi:sugar lactone lactonase YvrE
MGVVSVGDVRAELGEGPCWSARDQALWWVDIPAGLVHRTDPETGATATVALEPPVSSVHVRAAGGMLATTRAAVVELGSGREVAAVAVPARLRLNDAKPDPSGRLWAGTMDPDGRARAALYRIGTDGEPHAMLTGVTISNGLGWSPDGGRLYYADTATQRIDVFTFAAGTGALGARRAFASVPVEAGRPDGLAVDAEGGVWVALFGGGALHRHDARGRLDAVLNVPVRYPPAAQRAGAGKRPAGRGALAAAAGRQRAVRGRVPLVGVLDRGRGRACLIEHRP